MKILVLNYTELTINTTEKSWLPVFPVQVLKPAQWKSVQFQVLYAPWIHFIAIITYMQTSFFWKGLLHKFVGVTAQYNQYFQINFDVSLL